MPEVYTSENKHYYVYELKREKASLTSEEVLYYRQYYMTHTRDEVYIEFCKNKGNDFMKKGTFTKILIGDVRENSIYKQIPIYKKAKKQWLLNGNPVSTISGSGE